MARPYGERDNGWIIEPLKISDRIYEKVSSSNLFKFWMEGGDNKWIKNKVYRRYYECLIEGSIIMLEFSKKNNLIQRAVIASHNKNSINEIKAYLN